MCQEIRTGVLWSKKKKEYHINLLDLLAIKFALLTFSKTMNIQYIYIIQYIQYIYIQVDNQIALSYLLKTGGAMSQELLRVLKEIWDYLLKHQMMLSTAECLPGCLNHQADWELRNQKDSTE